MNNKFFAEMTEQSKIKSKIVSDYFGAWVKIMNKKARSNKIAYIDLFAGPGRYEDGSKSTPLMIIDMILANEELKRKMLLIFNDADPDYCSNLKAEIEKMDEITELKNKPLIFNSQVGDDIVDVLEKIKLVPTLAFIDPWGYKGLSSKLINALIKDWGSDCIFFFNYNRINMGINNKIVEAHMNAIFGEDRANSLRVKVSNLSPADREIVIINEMALALSEGGEYYVLPFSFQKPHRERTSHYIIFITKHILGYTIMKDIMHRHSSKHNDGIANFAYIPTKGQQLSFLSLFDRPTDELCDELCQCFRGQLISVKEIHDQHNINTPFVMVNYKEALKRLEIADRIECIPSKRRKLKGVKTMGDKVKIRFNS